MIAPSPAGRNCESGWRGLRKWASHAGIMIAIFQALAPIFLLILLGAALRMRGFVADLFWPSVERLVYFICLPCLLVGTLVHADLALGAVGPMAFAMAGGVVLTAAFALAIRRWTATDDPAFSSVFQGAIRPNTYVGLAAAASLFGSEGVGLMAVGIAATVPLVNVLAVTVLQRYGSNGERGLKAALLALVRNPLILAVTAGLALNLLGARLPVVIGDVMDALGDVALPLGLLAVGAGVNLRAIGAARRPAAISALAKLIVVPSATALCCWALGVDGVEAMAAILYHAVPTAAASYVLARQMGGDGPLMAGIITVTTIAAAVTMPIFLTIAGSVPM